MKKKSLLILVIVSAFFFLTSCTPAQNRVYALNEFRKAGAPQYVINKMDCVGYRESRWVESAVGGPNRNGTYDLGLFQINSIHAGDFQRVTGHEYWHSAKVAKYNVQYAIYLWRIAGTSPWAGPGC